MRVGILGTGEVGARLANAFTKRGHDVVVGSREKGRPVDDWHGKTATFAEAAQHGEIVVLAVKGDAVDAVVDAADPGRLAGKVVLDATNPLDFSKGAPPSNLYGLSDSNAERIQRKAPQAKVVKAFNTISHTRMADPVAGTRLLIAGDDAAAKKQVDEIARSFGWAGVVDAGGLEASRYLEALVPLWVRVGANLGRWDHQFDVRHG